MFGSPLHISADCRPELLDVMRNQMLRIDRKFHARGSVRRELRADLARGHHADIIARSNVVLNGVRTEGAERLALHIMKEQSRAIADLPSVLLAYA